MIDAEVLKDWIKARRDHHIAIGGKLNIQAATMQKVLTEMNSMDPLIVTAADLTCPGLEQI